MDHAPHFSVADNGEIPAHLFPCSENRRIEIGEKFRVQGFYCRAQIGFGDDDAHVQLGRSLRNHSDVHLAQGAEQSIGHPGSLANVIAHQAYDRLAVFRLHFGKLAKLVEDRRRTAHP